VHTICSVTFKSQLLKFHINRKEMNFQWFSTKQLGNKNFDLGYSLYCEGTLNDVNLLGLRGFKMMSIHKHRYVNYYWDFCEGSELVFQLHQRNPTFSHQREFTTVGPGLHKQQGWDHRWKEFSTSEQLWKSWFFPTIQYQHLQKTHWMFCQIFKPLFYPGLSLPVYN